METSEVLYKAADLIEERGWTAGSGWPGQKGRAPSSLCLEGGVMAALGESFVSVNLEAFWACPAYRAVQSYLDLPRELAHHDEDSYESPTHPLWQWNDTRSRTAAEVVEALRAAALIESAKEQDTVWVTYAEVVSA